MARNPNSFTPDERLLAAVDARGALRDRGRRLSKPDRVIRTVSFPVASPEVLRILTDAAQGRDSNIRSYTRRATLAFAAYDLGIPFSEISELDPRHQRFGDGMNEILMDVGWKIGAPWELE